MTSQFFCFHLFLIFFYFDLPPFNFHPFFGFYLLGLFFIVLRCSAWLFCTVLCCSFVPTHSLSKVFSLSWLFGSTLWLLGTSLMVMNSCLIHLVHGSY